MELSRGSVHTPIKHLAEFAASLPMHVDLLNKQPRRHRNRYVEYEIGNGKIQFSGDASKAVKQFSRTVKRIWPLLELARCMLEQMDHCTLTASVALGVFVPKQEIDGVPVKEWLASRKEAALKIDPETAMISRAYVNPANPYGVYSEIPDYVKEVTDDYYARAPGGKIWVYRGDLPEADRLCLGRKARARCEIGQLLSVTGASRIVCLAIKIKSVSGGNRLFARQWCAPCLTGQVAVALSTERKSGREMSSLSAGEPHCSPRTKPAAARLRSQHPATSTAEHNRV